MAEEAALEAWAATVAPTVRALSSAVAHPGQLAADARLWVQAESRAAKRHLRAVSDHVRDICASRSVGEALRKLGALRRDAPWLRWSQVLGRGLVCLYFLNSVVESRGLYVYYTQLFRRGRLPTGRPPAYPSLSVYLVLPAALLCALGWRVPLTAGLLSCELLREDTALLLRSLRALLTAGTRPNELLLKKLAMLGSVALVFVTGAREAARARSAARRAKLTCRRLSGGGGGSLQLALGEGGGEAAIGRRGSAGLLLGRLLLAALFAFVGQNQMLLSLPLALGWRTRAVAAALAACMLAEALSSWRFWEYAAGGEREGWRLGKLIHARSHFCTNLAVAGGLVLLAGAGPGRYTVDALLSKKRA